MTKRNKKRSIMKRYDLTAHIYDMRYAEEQKLKIEAALREMEIERQSAILDVGCGTGILFNYLAEKAATIVGLDISKRTLQQAKRKAKSFGNIHLVLADADKMPFKAAYFDYVFGITVLQNMPNPAETLKEIMRVAKDFARIVVTGMKKAFTFEEFQKLISDVNLKNFVVLNDSSLKCYVAICEKLGAHA